MDNGEPVITIVWDADDDAGSDSLPLADAVLDELYVFNESGWFDGNDMDFDELSGNRFSFRVQCGRAHLINGVVNGSDVYSVNQQYIAHNEPNSSSPRLWGRFETESGSALNWELVDNGPGYGADVWVDVPSCD